MCYYHESLPEVVDPEKLPLREMAPCWADGRVETVDYDNKEAQCECRYRICLVDWRNRISQSVVKNDEG